MKFLSLILILASTQSFAASDEAIKCMAQHREVMKSFRAHVKATDKVAADSLDTANYILATATSLIAQSDRLVGSYGYSVRRNGEVAMNNVNLLHGKAKLEEDKVLEAFTAMEDCLYGVEPGTDPTDPTEQK